MLVYTLPTEVEDSRANQPKDSPPCVRLQLVPDLESAKICKLAASVEIRWPPWCHLTVSSFQLLLLLKLVKTLN